MKSIILSIQPKWVAKILNGEKTIEVRKSCPKETPFKVYIYCTKGAELWSEPKSDDGYNVYGNKLNGKVVASFICDKVDFLAPKGIKDIPLYYSDKWLKGMISKACLTCNEAIAYQNNKSDLYALHISKLKIYNKPKEIGEFKHFCEDEKKCDNCKHLFCVDCEHTYPAYDCDVDGLKPIEKAPQNFIYCEELI